MNATTTLYPGYAPSWTQAQYEERISAWGGCIPEGMLYVICDGPNMGMYRASGSAAVQDVLIPDMNTLQAAVDLAVNGGQ